MDMIKDIAAVMGYVAVMGLVGCITAAGLIGCAQREDRALPATIQRAVFLMEEPADAGDGNT